VEVLVEKQVEGGTKGKNLEQDTAFVQPNEILSNVFQNKGVMA
jgi:hypothetical protein